MLDVMHYLLDEDLSYHSSEQAEFKSSVREKIYDSFYDRKYQFGMRKPVQTFADGDYDSIDGGAVNNEIKPYIPPTNFDPDAPNPFQGVLREGPLG